MPQKNQAATRRTTTELVTLAMKMVAMKIVAMKMVAARMVLGILIPGVLLHFDPFMLGGQDGESLVGSLSAGVYVLMFLCMAAFLIQLISGQRWPRLAGILCGAIFTGALLSALLGAVMVPFSIIAIPLNGLGLLGFYPFIVSALYFRTAETAFSEDATSLASRWPKVCRAFAGFVIVIAIPIVMVFAANTELDRLTAAASGGGLTRTHAARNVNWGVGWPMERYLTKAGDSDRIVRAYQRVRAERQSGDADVISLQALYSNLTGRDIEARLKDLAANSD
jgi:hypothetical protein